ncbi:MAG TPA: hypothetical protein VGK63_04735 [Candidatus Limnocylindrales bacterium]
MARDVARGIAALIGLILTGLGALGLVDNPLVGEHGLFGASPLLDLANVAVRSRSPPRSPGSTSEAGMA